ncbi:phosphopantetheine-binding protein [Streptomyces virginiae]|uniref:Phosphopantetheine-binding protein n=1 Tax=Streptomyces erythrochromogenes TaxID=285574 RepID=A0ABZ1Q648_9ACTN|nr:phosphopantetheine-binding protein [Streptomyces erythrochromogenes]MCX5582744.1 phosphopantetheine-binding protein [Streptomyces erythrochromogenes]
MSELTLPVLVEIFRECAGEADGADLDGEDVGDVELNVLGYDSLALLEAISQVERRYSIGMPDAETRIKTLNQFLEQANEQLVQRS